LTVIDSFFLKLSSKEGFGPTTIHSKSVDTCWQGLWDLWDNKPKDKKHFNWCVVSLCQNCRYFSEIFNCLLHVTNSFTSFPPNST